MKNSPLLKLLSLLLCLLLLPVLPAMAAGSVEEPEYELIDPAALDEMVDDYLSSHGVNPDAVSIGYVYLETGDTWFHNPDYWMYGASTYKVPLMMLFGQLEAQGELTQDSDILGLTLSRAEDLILVHSHNDYAHMVMKYFGTEPECVELFKQFSPLPEDYYAENFTEWRYFTARYLTDVLKTLYAEPDRFPHIMECLLRANRGEYFDAVWSGQYDVAQKYGSLTTDYTDVNHTIGIIYTPHPFILVVMTDHVGGPWTVIRDMARMFGDYTLSLEDALAEKQAAEEAERLRQEEEAARLAEEERVRREAEANRPPEGEQTGTITLSPDPDATPRPAQTDPPQNAGNNIRLWVILGVAVLLLALIPIAIRSRRRNRVGV